jgi:multisite-specific tRNA:(cytosine-C5)-methyltransferase
MLPKEERRAMLLRLYNDESPLIDHSQEHKKPKAESSKAESSKAESKPLTKSEVNGERCPNGEDVKVEGNVANTSSEDEGRD